MTRKVLLVLVGVALFFLLATQSDKSYRAEQFDVDVAIMPDRSLVVDETVRFRFTGGPFSYVFRELPTDHTDGITDIVAGVDGVPWPQGNGPGEVEISGTNPIEVMWHLSPTADTVQNFTLTYRPLGVVRSSAGSDVLDWQALPDEYDYSIDSSRVTFTFPPGATLDQEPEILAGKATGSTEPGSTTFRMQDLSSGDPLVVRMSFAAGAFSPAAPVWETQQAVENSRAWIWFVAAGLILVIGVAAFYRAARPYSRTVPKPTSTIYKPPVDLSPALAGFLANQTVGWHHALATLFDLAGRGLLEIEQIGEKSMFRSAEFAVTLLNREQSLRPHEQALIDLLFTDKKGVEQEVVTLAEMGRLVTSSRWKTYTTSLEEEAASEGLLDPVAKQTQKRVVVWSVLVLFLAFALFIVGFLLDTWFGFWPLVTVGAVLLLGFLGFIFAAAISPLSDKGFQYATALEPFRKMLKDVSKGSADLPDMAYYEAYLPYATAYGIAEPWVKEQAKSGYNQIPAYFRAIDASGAEMAAFVAIISAASHSGGAASAAAGASGAASAGGGASGAG